MHVFIYSVCLKINTVLFYIRFIFSSFVFKNVNVVLHASCLFFFYAFWIFIYLILKFYAIFIFISISKIFFLIFLDFRL